MKTTTLKEKKVAILGWCESCPYGNDMMDCCMQALKSFPTSAERAMVLDELGEREINWFVEVHNVCVARHELESERFSLMLKSG